MDLQKGPGCDAAGALLACNCGSFANPKGRKGKPERVFGLGKTGFPVWLVTFHECDFVKIVRCHAMLSGAGIPRLVGRWGGHFPTKCRPGRNGSMEIWAYMAESPEVTQKTSGLSFVSAGRHGGGPCGLISSVPSP